MDNNLIQINYENENPTVSARDLHRGLEVTERFQQWFDRQLQYGFEEKVDFTSVKTFTLVNNGASRELQDYQITVDMAKQICMIQRTDKGRQYREYFLTLEKAWNTPEQVFARALKMADKEIAKLKESNQVLLEDNERMRPKEIFADAVTASKTSILIGEFAKILCQNGFKIGQNRLFKWFRENGYLMSSGERYNMPTQRAMELKVFEIIERTINNPDGSIRVTRTVKLNGKGQVYFLNKFMTEEVVA